MITKLALDLLDARRIVKDVVAPKFIRYAKRHRFAGMPSAVSYRENQVKKIVDGILSHAQKTMTLDPAQLSSSARSQMYSAAKSAKAAKKRHIRWGSPGIKEVKRVAATHTGDNPGEVYRGLNDLVALHENAELGNAGKAYKLLTGKQNIASRFASHVHPDVIMQEHNMLSTLTGQNPKTVDAVKANMRGLREMTGEADYLDSIIPGGFSSGPRLSRHMRRHLSNKIIKQLNPDYIPAKPKLIP